jgi:uncharacterized protein (TIGR00255 family)
VEVKTVNHRYLDVTVRTPRLYVFLEEPLRQKASAAIARGKTDVFLTLERVGGAEMETALNPAVIQGYLDAAGALRETYAVPGELTVDTLLRLPDALTVRRRETDEAALRALVSRTADGALSALREARLSEGEKLKADVLSRLGAIESLVRRLEARWPQLTEDYRVRLETRLRETLGGLTLDEGRIAQEAALFADRVAVNEELVRLYAHIGAVRALLDEPGQIGRKLDFLVQEMGRETNTVGSKCSDLDMQKVVIDLKSELEKIKEQGQNLE